MTRWFEELPETTITADSAKQGRYCTRDVEVTGPHTLSGMATGSLFERETTHHVIGAFCEVYNTLGYGFLENVYRDALELELTDRERIVRKEVFVPVWYKRSLISRQRVDLIVDEKVVVEIKSTEFLPHDSPRQLRNYLQATTFEVGMLLHFGPKARFYRLVHTHKPESFRSDSPDPQ
jgi:GxxExxY protein